MVPIEVIFKFLIVFAIAFFFYQAKKPKVSYFFYGILFFCIALLLQLPFKLLEYHFNQLPYLFFQVSSVVIALLAICLSELTKYFSLKKYLKTKSLKNGIFFGLGWIGFESISFLSITLYSILFSIFSISFNPNYLVSPTLYLWDFVYFFVVNATITMFVISSVIRKKKIYFFYGLFLSSLIYVVLYFIKENVYVEMLFLIYCLITLFTFNKFIR